MPIFEIFAHGVWTFEKPSRVIGMGENQFFRFFIGKAGFIDYRYEVSFSD